MNKVETKLSCGHSIRQHVLSENAKVGKDAYCRFDGYVVVEIVYYNEWRVICADCQYVRWEGQDEKFAGRTAKLHMKNKRYHRCFVVKDQVNTRGGTPRKKLILDYLTEVEAASRVTPEPDPNAVPPF